MDNKEIDADSSRRVKRCKGILCVAGIFASFSTVIFVAGITRGNILHTDSSGSSILGFTPSHNLPSDGGEAVPAPLINLTYSLSHDFCNKAGVVPSYWDCSRNGRGGSSTCNTTFSWGPCFPPHTNIDWLGEVSRYKEPVYDSSVPAKGIQDVSGLCRPGFIIIGAGKCGTSSLYHYLTEHPRVLPAREKQIHYFKVSW
jgi:hypothetical protein